MRQVKFTFQRSYGESAVVSLERILTVPLTVPLPNLFQQLILKHDVPPVAHEDLYRELKEFVGTQNKLNFSGEYSKSLDLLAGGLLDVHELSGWFQEENCGQTYVPTTTFLFGISEDELFGQAYNRVIHSSAALNLIRLEQSMAMVINNEIVKRNEALRLLDEDTVRLTDQELQRRDVDVPSVVTELQQSHIQRRELEEGRWNSCISELRRIQRRHLRDFVMSLDAELNASASGVADGIEESGTIEHSFGSITSCIQPNPTESPIKRSVRLSPQSSCK